MDLPIVLLPISKNKFAISVAIVGAVGYVECGMIMIYV